MLGMVINEQKKAGSKRSMSAVLWDTFTGSAPYTDILRRFMNPLLIITLIWQIIKSNFKAIVRGKSKR